MSPPLPTKGLDPPAMPGGSRPTLGEYLGPPPRTKFSFQAIARIFDKVLSKGAQNQIFNIGGFILHYWSAHGNPVVDFNGTQSHCAQGRGV